MGRTCKCYTAILRDCSQSYTIGLCSFQGRDSLALLISYMGRGAKLALGTVSLHKVMFLQRYFHSSLANSQVVIPIHTATLSECLVPYSESQALSHRLLVLLD